MQVEFTPDQTLYPFESRWFDSSAGRMHYIDEGSGPALLLCHGNPTWSFLYRHIVLALRDRFRCVAPDLIGFGLSERPAAYGYSAAEHVRTLGELVDALALDGYVVVGQDWGGPTGLGVAIEHPERIRGVVLGNTWFWPATPYFQLFSRIMSSPPLQRRIIERNAFVDELMPRAMRRTLTAGERDHYRGVQPTPAARRGVAELPRQIRSARPLLERLAHEVPARLGAKPALLTWGMKDLAFRPRACLPRMRAAFDDHELVELPRAAHYIQEDAPDEIAAAIARRF